MEGIKPSISVVTANVRWVSLEYTAVGKRHFLINWEIQKEYSRDRFFLVYDAWGFRWKSQ